MARKGWDSLSDKYRKRLINKGITAESYASGASLAHARGHRNEDYERFMRETQRFANAFVKYTPDTDFVDKFGTRDPKARLRDNVRKMGPNRGRQYMRNARRSLKAYESGNIDLAKSLWLQRDQSLPAYMYWYHGVFAF